MNLAYNDIILDEGWDKAFKWFVILSIVFHAVVLYFSLAVLPELSSRTRVKPPVYTVNLVSLPPAPPPAPAAPPETPVNPDLKIPPIQEVPPEPEPAPAELIPVGPVKPKEPDKPKINKIETPPPKPEIKPIEEPKPKPKPKEEPKPKPKRKVNPNRRLNNRLKQLEAKVKRDKEDQHLAAAMANIAAKRSAGDGDTSNPATIRGNGASELNSRMRDYYVVIYNILTANWNMPPAKMLSSEKKLEAIYVVRISPSGKVTKGWFEKKSGEDLFDASAKKAVKKSKFPPLPDVFQGGSIEVGLRFTPSGVRKK